MIFQRQDTMRHDRRACQKGLLYADCIFRFPIPGFGLETFFDAAAVREKKKRSFAALAGEDFADGVVNAVVINGRSDFIRERFDIVAA